MLPNDDDGIKYKTITYEKHDCVSATQIIIIIQKKYETDK